MPGRPFLLPGVVLAVVAATLLLALPAAAAPGWTGPAPIGAPGDCRFVSVAVDGEGAIHAASACESSVRYLTNESGTWRTWTFSRPAGRLDQDPKVSVDGDTVHVAYTRRQLVVGEGLRSIGVYHRERALGGDTWSTAARIGPSGDELEDMQVVDGALHLAIRTRAGALAYETDGSGELERYTLPGGTGQAALDVGTDGAARLVYSTQSFLRYAIFHGSGVEWSIIPRTSSDSIHPRLALDADNRAHVTWSIPDLLGIPAAGVGVFYSTNATGEWTRIGTGKVTANFGLSAIEVNAAGRPEIVVSASAAVKHYTLASVRAWGGLTIDPRPTADADLAIDPGTGRLVVLASESLDSGGGRLVILTRP
jgi:hypothetical protein